MVNKYNEQQTATLKAPLMSNMTCIQVNKDGQSTINIIINAV